MHMNRKNRSIIAALKTRQRNDNLTQLELAAALGIHQGHLSKVLSGKVPLSRKLNVKVERLLEGDAAPTRVIEILESEVVQELRSSSAFRTFMRAAMQLHQQRSNNAGSDGQAKPAGRG